MSDEEVAEPSLGDIFEAFFGSQLSEKKPRRRTTESERRQPCRLCCYPISQRHHLLEVSRYGENDWVIQLCANCHELFHIVHTARLEAAQKRFRAYSMGIFTSLWVDGRVSHDHMRRHLQLAELAIRLEHAAVSRAPESAFHEIHSDLRVFLNQVYVDVARDIDKHPPPKPPRDA